MTLVAVLERLVEKRPVASGSRRRVAAARRNWIPGYSKSRFIVEPPAVRPLLRKQPVGRIDGIVGDDTWRAPASKTQFRHGAQGVRMRRGRQRGRAVERDVRLDHHHVALFDEPVHAAERADGGADGFFVFRAVCDGERGQEFARLRARSSEAAGLFPVGSRGRNVSAATGRNHPPPRRRATRRQRPARTRNSRRLMPPSAALPDLPALISSGSDFIT